MKLKSINPATGETTAEYEELEAAHVDALLSKSHEAFRAWRETGFADRARILRQAASILRSKADDYAATMAQEMGKPMRQGRAEAEKCAWACEYYADNAKGFLQPEIIETEASRSYVAFEPIGPILAIMPWNYPFWQLFRFVAPALMSGNVVVLKHASNVPGCALAIEQLLLDAGVPAGVFQTLLIGSGRVASVIESRFVKGITLTGSADAGRAVAARAGQALKKTVLELGGSDPYIILEDAELGAAVDACVAGKLLNCGQTCIAPKRFIVVESVREPFEALMIERMSASQTGDPLLEETELGPMARHNLRNKLHRQVVDSVEKGANCLLGGEVPKGDGAYYPPTVLTGVTKGMPAYDEEVFGPVAAIVPVRDEDEAVRVANESVYGLGAAVFTSDTERGERVIQRLEAGCCSINDFVRSDPRLPFGGIKGSGYGRELSHYGIKEFVNIKTVVVK
jgi:succinate-semialdehyde dehydrogenase/glutarate-semialdehyde dehydrogenase